MVKRFFFLFLSISALEASDWAKTTLSLMTLDEKIGQLFLIAGYVDPDFSLQESCIFNLDSHIVQYHPGGIAYAGPSEILKQIALTNHYQSLSKYPLLIAQDLEWGLGMRLKDGIAFPKNMTLGAIEDNQLIYETGREIGKQAKQIGVHINLSPVLDVNSEPENIAINVRSFSSNANIVAEKGVAMIRGLQDSGVIASAKHFPGLGAITKDSHLNLPISYSCELYPFEQAIKAGVMSIQTDHALFPTLDPELPSSLSPLIVKGLLKEKLRFDGLIISGALRMKALTNTMTQEDIVLKAFLAGSDMLLMPQDFPRAFNAIKMAFDKGKITEKEIEERVYKILKLKENINPIIPLEKPSFVSAQHLKKDLFRNAVKFIRKTDFNIPPKIAFVRLDENFQEQFCYDDLEKYPLIILAVYPVNPRSIVKIRLLSQENQKEALKNFRVHGILESYFPIIEKFKQFREKLIVAYFGNPYGLHFFNDFPSLLMCHEDDPDAQQAALDLIKNGSKQFLIETF